LAYREPKATLKVIVTPEELQVVDVKAPNLKEIVIEFNGEVASKLMKNPATQLKTILLNWLQYQKTRLQLH